MTSATNYDYNEDMILSATLTYDVYGNLVAKSVNGGPAAQYAYRITDASPGITNSVHELWAFLNDDGSIGTRFLNGDNPNERIAQQTIRRVRKLCHRSRYGISGCWG